MRLLYFFAGQMVRLDTLIVESEHQKWGWRCQVAVLVTLNTLDRVKVDQGPVWDHDMTWT